MDELKERNIYKWLLELQALIEIALNCIHSEGTIEMIIIQGIKATVPGFTFISLSFKCIQR